MRELPYSNYPPGVSDADFTDEGMRQSKRKPFKLPATVMVYCPKCMRHYEAPTNENYPKARVELCAKHSQEVN